MRRRVERDVIALWLHGLMALWPCGLMALWPCDPNGFMALMAAHDFALSCSRIW